MAGRGTAPCQLVVIEVIGNSLLEGKVARVPARLIVGDE